MFYRYFSAKEVCDICGISTRRFAYLVSEGIVTSINKKKTDKKRRMLYNYTALLTVKVVEKYTRQGIKVRAIGKSLSNLKKILGKQTNLTNCSLISDGKNLYAENGQKTLESLGDDHQLSFLFKIDDCAAEIIASIESIKLCRYTKKHVKKEG